MTWASLICHSPCCCIGDATTWRWAHLLLEAAAAAVKAEEGVLLPSDGWWFSAPTDESGENEDAPSSEVDRRRWQEDGTKADLADHIMTRSATGDARSMVDCGDKRTVSFPSKDEHDSLLLLLLCESREGDLVVWCIINTRSKLARQRSRWWLVRWSNPADSTWLWRTSRTSRAHSLNPALNLVVDVSSGIKGEVLLHPSKPCWCSFWTWFTVSSRISAFSNLVGRAPCKQSDRVSASLLLRVRARVVFLYDGQVAADAKRNVILTTHLFFNAVGLEEEAL